MIESENGKPEVIEEPIQPLSLEDNEEEDELSNHDHEFSSKPLNIESHLEEDLSKPNFKEDAKDLEVHRSPGFPEQVESTVSEEIRPDSKKPESPENPEIDQLNKAFDRSQEESQEKLEISDQLENERKKELEEAGRKLKIKMFKQQRCHICTLSIPCKHFSTMEEAYNQNPIFGSKKSQQKDDAIGTMSKSKSAFILSPPRQRRKMVHKDFLKKGEGIQPGYGVYTSPEKLVKVYEQKYMHKQVMQDYEQCGGPQKIRIQRGPGKYEVITVTPGMTLHEHDQDTLKKQQHREDKERSKQLAQLMKYKEEKLMRNQEMLEYEKKQRERERKYEQKMLEKQNKHSEKLKKQLDEWGKQREEKDRKQEEEEESKYQKQQEGDKAKDQYFENQKKVISEYKQDLHKKNTELLQFLSTTKSAKKLGNLKLLKDSKMIEKIDFSNDYHLPQIVRAVEMLDKKQNVCERFLCKHKSIGLTDITPRSRKLSKRAPLTHRSRNTNEVHKVYANTQTNLFSPQHSQKNTKLMYSTLNKEKTSPIKTYIKKRADEAKGSKHEPPNYSDDKIPIDFKDYNKDNVDPKS
jgi:hypothetical protein